MQEILALTLHSLQGDMARIDHVAMNLANVTTPGYRRQVLAVRPFAEAVQGLAAQAGPDGTLVPALPPAAEVYTDARPGTLKNTGQPLDLALTGEGYFEVLTDNGPAYTRKGDFSVDARGRLVTAQGYPVMGRSGEIRLTGRTPTIDAAGNVTETTPDNPAPVSVGQLKIVRFDKGERLGRLGEGLLAPAADNLPGLDDGKTQVRQGSLENANVNTTREMVDLIQTMRHFESMHRVVQGYDEMMGTAIRKLAEI